MPVNLEPIWGVMFEIKCIQNYLVCNKVSLICIILSDIYSFGKVLLSHNLQEPEAQRNHHDGAMPIVQI